MRKWVFASVIWASWIGIATAANIAGGDYTPSWVDTLQEGTTYWGGTWTGGADGSIHGGATHQLFNYGAAPTADVGYVGATAGVSRAWVFCDLNLGLRDSINSVIDSLILELSLTAQPQAADTALVWIMNRAILEGEGNATSVPGMNWLSCSDSLGLSDLWRIAGASGADSSNAANFVFTPHGRFLYGVAPADTTYDISRYPIALMTYPALSGLEILRFNVTLAGRAWQYHEVANRGLWLTEANEVTGRYRFQMAENGDPSLAPRWIIYSHLGEGLPVSGPVAAGAE